MISRHSGIGRRALPLITALLALAGCGGRAQSSSPRLVVLVVIDTLRDDHLTAERMPRTVAALAGARRFTGTRANASWTLPSMASALTSRPVGELSGSDGTLVGIPEAETTLAERLHGAGFATGAFVANGTLRRGNGFAQGFDRFETPTKPEDPSPDAATVVASARAFLAAQRGRDAFVWLHLMEPHEPWPDREGRGRVAVQSHVVAHRERLATAAETTAMRELYALDVAACDAALAPFLEELPPDAVIVVTADHGELLGEGETWGGVWGHGLTVYDTVLAVPLLVRAPGVAAGDDPRPAELLDLVPTLLARLPREEPGETGAPLSGVDLVSAPLSAGRPRLAATWSAGPLRWSYRRGDLAALAHFSTQAEAASTAAVAVRETLPLPAGIWAYDPRLDPMAERGVPLGGADLAEVAAAFAHDLGAMVPGFQALVVGEAPGGAVEFETAGAARLAQLFAAAPLAVERAPGRLRISMPKDSGFVLAAFAADEKLRPLGEGWSLGRDAPPAIANPGRASWRNPRPARSQEPQAELVEHLRALGYLR